MRNTLSFRKSHVAVMQKCLFLLALILFASQAFGQIRERPTRGDDGLGFPDEEGNILDSVFVQDQDSTGQIIVQNTDTINFQSVVREFTKDLERDEIQFSLDDVFNYYPAVKQDEPTLHLGINGTPLYSLTWSQNYLENLPIGLNAMQEYALDPNEYKYYKAERPFTQLLYVTGTGRENRFKIKHTQNWGRGLNVGFDYQRLVNNGIYANQANDHNNVGMHAWFKSKNKKFNSMLQYVNNKYRVNANGGIVDGVDYFANDDFDRRDAIPVYLESAISKHNSNNLRWQNSYDLGKLIPVKINDSISDVELIPRFRLQHTVNTKRDLERFDSDNIDTLLYDNVFIYGIEQGARDRHEVKQLANEFRIKWLGNKADTAGQLVRQNFLADAYARYSHYNITSLTGDSTDTQLNKLSDLVIGGNFRSNEKDSANLVYAIEGAYHLLDYRQGDYHLKGELGYDINNSVGKIVGFVEWVNQVQPYTSQNYISNHFIFANNFDKVNARTIGGAYKNEAAKFTAGLRYTNASNVLYYNGNSLPQVDGDAVSYVLANASKAIKFGKFNADLRGWYQVVSEEETINKPDYYIASDIYFKGELFKANVFSKIGLHVDYLPKYNLQTFNPALGQFNNQIIEYAGQPRVNFYSAFSLSRARIFLRLDNITSFLNQEPVFIANRKPLHDFAFRAGINWVFVN